MSNGKYKIQTRDWVYIIVLSIILQFIIYFLAFVYSNSTNALNYVSFAGTMISIVLAIIAIGYTYGESIRQKHNEDELIIQIRGLSEIKEKLGDQVSLLENVASLKQSVDEKLEASHIWIKENVSKYANYEKNENFGTPNITKVDNNQNYLINSNYIFDIYVITLYKVIAENNTENFEQFIKGLFKYIKNKEKNEGVAFAKFEASMAVWSILNSLSLIEENAFKFDVSKFYKEKYEVLEDIPATELRELIKGI